MFTSAGRAIGGTNVLPLRYGAFTGISQFRRNAPEYFSSKAICVRSALSLYYDIFRSFQQRSTTSNTLIGLQHHPDSWHTFAYWVIFNLPVFKTARASQLTNLLRTIPRLQNSPEWVQLGSPRSRKSGQPYSHATSHRCHPSAIRLQTYFFRSRK